MPDATAFGSPVLPSRARAARSSLVAPWDQVATYTRSDLAALAQSGLRGLRVDRPVHLSVTQPTETVRFVALLIDAASVGLRMHWRAEEIAIEPALLAHLDPPVDADGTPAWPVPPAPLLVVRYGPGFVQLDDLRAGRVDRRVLSDEPYGRLLRRYASPRRAHRTDLAALGRMCDSGLALSCGDFRLALPVRFRYARA